MCERFAREVPKGREVPKCAKSQNARSPKRRMTADSATFVRAFGTSRRSTPHGTSRTMGLRVLWDFAYYGTSRSMGLRALWDFALYGTSRPLALRAFWDSPPLVVGTNCMRSVVPCRRAASPAASPRYL